MPGYRIAILSVTLLLGACASAGADIVLPTATPAIQRFAPQVTATHTPPAVQPLPTSSPTATAAPTPTRAPSATPRPPATRLPSATATSPPIATEAQATVTPATATAPARSGNCDPAYPDVCIPPPPPDLDCPEIPHRRFTVLPPDPHRFDADKNGVGCERD